MTPAARRALELRQSLSKSSLSKLDALVLREREGVVRHTFWYYGAHTGRWAGRGIQPQNFPRGTVAPEYYEAAVKAIQADGELSQYGVPTDVLASCLRAAIQAPEGHKLLVCDFAQVELRVLAWLSSCEKMQTVFRNNGDLYMAFAREHLYRRPEVTKCERQVAKSAVLGCGYGQGAGYMRVDRSGDPEPSGLWGYAAKMGVELTQEEAFTAVRAFRDAYRPVVSYWYACQDAAIAAVNNPGDAFPAGPVVFQTTAPQAKILFAILPSGRRLFYLRPRVESEYDGRQGLYYEGQKFGKWREIRTYGGHLVENLAQAVARDLLAEAMLAADKAGFTIVGHAHDEIICCEKQDGKTIAELEAFMSTTPAWAEGMLLAAEGYESVIYRK